jgi:hypothetical protein
MNGHVVSGLGVAKNAIELQKPFLRPYFPEIDACQIGTINIKLEHALDVRIPDIVTSPIAWQPGSQMGERFGLTKINVEVSEQRHEAWIYGAEFSSHRFNYMMVELLARPIEAIAPEVTCVLHIDRFTGYIVV